jgi:transposase
MSIPIGFSVTKVTTATRFATVLLTAALSVIPPRSNRKTPIEYDRKAYKRRNLIERCVNRLKQFRRIATRYEKTARAYLSMLRIASTMLWLKTVNTT